MKLGNLKLQGPLFVHPCLCECWEQLGVVECFRWRGVWLQPEQCFHLSTPGKLEKRDPKRKGPEFPRLQEFVKISFIFLVNHTFILAFVFGILFPSGGPLKSYKLKTSQNLICCHCCLQISVWLFSFFPFLYWKLLIYYS